MDPIQTLNYSIHKYSSYSGHYNPTNILVDEPKDQNSRWASEGNQHPQFLILKLEKPAIVQKITFGKFEKTHVCNLKKFRIYSGLEENIMTLVFKGGLKNDSNKETFLLKHKIRDKYLPSLYIKIEPLQTWGPSFNYSIWHISLKGNDCANVINESIRNYHYQREKEAVRLCLKFLRQRNYLDVFHLLKRNSNISLENSLLTKLYEDLVVHGNFKVVEESVLSFVDKGWFNNYIKNQKCMPKWKMIIPSNKNENPEMRGGHQMCIDNERQKIFLYGGWNGSKDLNDFWVFDVPTNKWFCLSKDVSLENGPSARSCHKMCIDPLRKKIYTIGRYLDEGLRNVAENLRNDFFVYDYGINKWTLISEDTAAQGGPKLLIDHRICIDVDKNVIFMFGGRIISKSIPPEERQSLSSDYYNYSPLFSYDVNTNVWNQIDLEIRPENNYQIRSRVGHSMIFHKHKRLLYILTGQTNKFLGDFFTYNVDTREINIICDGLESSVPFTGFTQRSTLDLETNEIFVLSGFYKDNDDKDENSIRNSFWLYDIEKNTWTQISREEVETEDIPNNEPCPRYAHQIVLNTVNKLHYLFGGNPGKNTCKMLRLDDFWSLNLCRIKKEDVKRKIKKIIRILHFKEIIMRDEIESIHYLQKQLYETFDHNNPNESNEFHELASLVFKNNEDEEKKEILNRTDDVIHFQRMQLYEALVNFFPDEMTEPKINLLDLIRI